MLRGGTAIGAITRAAARMTVTLTTLLPSASPREISGAPLSAELMATVSSGLEVANAAIVAAMMPGEMRAALARPTVPLMKSSPPPPAKASPNSNATQALTDAGPLFFGARQSDWA